MRWSIQKIDLLQFFICVSIQLTQISFCLKLHFNKSTIPSLNNLANTDRKEKKLDSQSSEVVSVDYRAMPP